MRDVNTQIRVIHLFDFPLSSTWTAWGLLPVLKVFAFSTIKIPIIALSAAVLSRLLGSSSNVMTWNKERKGANGEMKEALRRKENILCETTGSRLSSYCNALTWFMRYSQSQRGEGENADINGGSVDCVVMPSDIRAWIQHNLEFQNLALTWRHLRGISNWNA